MSDSVRNPFVYRVGLLFRLLAQPTGRTLQEVTRASAGLWAPSLLIYVLGSTSAFALASWSHHSPMGPVSLLSTAFAFGLLALGWAGAAQAAFAYLIDKRINLFEPLLYLSATSLLVLLFAAILTSSLPSPIGPISLLLLLYTQVVVVLTIKTVGRTTTMRAVIVAAVASVLGFIAALMISAIIAGMPGFFERGFLL